MDDVVIEVACGDSHGREAAIEIHPAPWGRTLYGPRQPPQPKRGWLARLLSRRPPPPTTGCMARVSHGQAHVFAACLLGVDPDRLSVHMAAMSNGGAIPVVLTPAETPWG